MGGMWIWWLVGLAFAVGVIWFLFSRAGGTKGGGQGDGQGESAEQSLKRRYANGEIDRETYDQMLTDLRK